jgi:hypothetical protein
VARDVGSNNPDGTHGIRVATRNYNEALRRYRDALQAFTDLVLKHSPMNGIKRFLKNRRASVRRASRPTARCLHTECSRRAGAKMPTCQWRYVGDTGQVGSHGLVFPFEHARFCQVGPVICGSGIHSTR